MGSGLGLWDVTTVGLCPGYWGRGLRKEEEGKYWRKELREENKEEKERIKIQEIRSRLTDDLPEKPVKFHPVLFEIKSLNLDELTGKQALDKLYDFQQAIEN